MNLNAADQGALLRSATATEGAGGAMPRALLLFAHPDDEVIALGARLRRFSSAFFLHATDGAPRNEEDSRAHGFLALDDYRAARDRELQAALTFAGIASVQRESLRFADQTASLHLAELTQVVTDRLRSFSPDVLFTHPYEGGHPDHDACAFAAHRAAAQIAEEGRRPPVLLEAAFYHLGSEGMATGAFLDDPLSPETVRYELSEVECIRKRDLLACFATQRDTLRYFPLDREIYRIAPHYEFSLPPHPGRTFYDRFAWGMQSSRFCQLATNADAVLAEERTVA